MIDVTQAGTLGGLAIILGVLVQALKPAIPDPRKPLIPWLAALMGVILSLLVAVAMSQTTSAMLANHALTGLMAGFVATGFYQATIDPLKPSSPGPTAFPPVPPRG